jgi:hypothetical protein
MLINDDRHELKWLLSHVDKFNENERLLRFLRRDWSAYLFQLFKKNSKLEY